MPSDNSSHDLFGLAQEEPVGEEEGRPPLLLSGGVVSATREQLLAFYKREDAWKNRSLARYVSKIRGVHKRREALDRLEKLHGQESVDKIKALVVEIFSQKQPKS